MGIIGLIDYEDKSSRQRKQKKINRHQINLKKPMNHPQTLQNQLKLF